MIDIKPMVSGIFFILLKSSSHEMKNAPHGMCSRVSVVDFAPARRYLHQNLEYCVY
ncbi:hypothetical protein SAMN05421730_100579 [Anaerobium acetethylicum]|uniref:Uncharacterized protein n=1 Tax=Anaerobium acetethylicum TaxID=1619234 RepID=A0A1D3TS23_9FIRM|nr:hypothetical protein SAMN05421730_100579 [Anaerobium acetethylicum]